MKTTLDIPDELFQRTKNVAHERRTSFKAIVIEALERSLGPESKAITPLQTHVWPPESAGNARIESENILRMIRLERDGGSCLSSDSNHADRNEPSSSIPVSEPARKVRQ